ncbi:MAG: cytochrome c biogenesis protein CcdA [Clostridia bacterium]|nr:cytochrome c biogenesis protein CcdA [Clostridia bacterium]
MQYLLSFLEGIITFISPCLLPMLPVYFIYFSGTSSKRKTSRTLKNTIGFVLGFSIIFVLLGAFAGSVGGLLKQHQTAINIITGAIVILLGLNFVGVLQLKFLNKGNKSSSAIKPTGFLSSILFGIVFSIGWTPCVSAFLGSALMLASQQGSALQGVIMLVFYSLGLGIPFILSALLIDKLKSTFDFIMRNYKTINIVCGILLIITGILMMSGNMGLLLSIIGG